MILCSLKRFCTIPDSHETIKILITVCLVESVSNFFFNKKYFSVKNKFGLVFKKIFFFYFGRKILFRSKNFKNIILFVDYNKFGP